MKKFAKYLTLPLAIIAALSFSACDFGTPSTGSSSSSEAPTESSSSLLEDSSSSEVEDSSSSEAESSSSEEEYVAPTTVADAVAVALANADKVVTGAATSESTTKAWGDPQTTVSSLTYSLISGKYLETTMVTSPDTDPVTEAFRYVLLEDGLVYGVAYDQWNDQWNAAYEPTVENLGGYDFRIGDSLGAKGAENWLNTLYTWAAELPAENKTNVPLTESVEDGVYSFSFDYATSLYYQVSVSFTLDENGMCDSLAWSVNSWYDGQTKDDDGNWLTMETTDAAGNTITVPAGADWSGTYKADFAWDVENECWYLVAAQDSWDDSQAWALTQSAEGEVEDRASQFRITSLDIVDLEGNEIPDTITLMAGGDAVIWQMTNILPDTAVFTANNFNYAYEQDAMDSWALNVSIGYTDWTTWEEYPDRIKLSSSTVGEYNLSITVNGTEVKKVLVKVETPLPTSVSATAWVQDGNNWSYEDMGETYEMYAGKTLFVSALADVMTADHSSEIVVTDASGNEVDCWTSTIVDYYSTGDINAIAFAPTAIGTYTITVTSTVVEGLTDSVVVNVVEAPSYLDVFTGKYAVSMYGSTMGSIEFAAGTTENTGTATISMNVTVYDEYWNSSTETWVSVYSWTITEENGIEVFSKTLTEGSSLLDFDVDADFNLIVTRDDDGYLQTYDTEAIVVRSYEEILSGSYTFGDAWSGEGTIVFADGQATISINVEVQDPDTWEFVFVTYTAVYSYTVEGETLALTAVSGDTDALNFSIDASYRLVVSYNSGYNTQWGDFWNDFVATQAA